MEHVFLIIYFYPFRFVLGCKVWKGAFGKTSNSKALVRYQNLWERFLTICVQEANTTYCSLAFLKTDC